MDLPSVILLALIAGPIALAVLALVAPNRATRGAVALLAAGLTAAASIAMAVLCPQGPAELLGGHAWQILGFVNIGHVDGGGMPIGALVELGLIAVVLLIAIRIRSIIVGVLALAQLGMAVAMELLPHAEGNKEHAALQLDPLATVLVLVVSVVGSLIVVYAIGYMRNHAHHAPPTARREGVFFFFLIGFLGAMNGLVLADSLTWLSIFWEATTICSFMLIGQDQTPEARRNAWRALAINSIGGLAMVGASLLASMGGTDSMAGVMGAKLLAPMSLLALAAFTKSAQMPFQSWLLGAMVAPTPVSALLHSATMVKAGSYLMLRMAPAMAGTSLALVVSIAGAFTFAAASGLAITQSNGKKVLAYSTIANLGLIVACAGIGTPLAYTAGIMILVFHAVSKGLLFLCIGAIEQKIGSRDIEDMGQITFQMPLTTIVTLIGMLSMLIPPFGMLLSKWMAIEAAIFSPVVLMMVVIGSALTVMFWCKWIGRIQTVSYHDSYKLEHLPPSMWLSMLVLAGGVLAMGITVFHIVGFFIPIAESAYPRAGGGWQVLESAQGMLVWPLYIIAGLSVLASVVAIVRLKPRNVRQPFLCGENIEGTPRTYLFRGIADRQETAWAGSYYLRDVLTEGRLTFWCNLLAGMITLTMFGVLRYV